jgi:CRISPR-associated protein Csx3
MAKVGDAERLWTALQVVNPVSLAESVANAMPRQSNVYFSSSDADFSDRITAALRWGDLRTGKVGVRGGWRLYSSGPGLFIHNVRSCLLGLRESFGDVVFDPVLPRSLDGLVASATLCGRLVRLVYHVKAGTHSPRSVRVNGVELKGGKYESNPYRTGGLRLREADIRALLSAGENTINVEL